VPEQSEYLDVVNVGTFVTVPLLLLAIGCGGATEGSGAATAVGGVPSGASGASVGTGGVTSGAGGATNGGATNGGATNGNGGVAAGEGGVASGVAGVSTDAGGTGGQPPSDTPALPPFVPPQIGPLGAFHVTFHNRCAQTVWPAWGATGGLDNSVIDPQLWLPMAPQGDRTVVVYGGVGEIGVWGRTGCSFDRAGNGVCETGECGGFICPIRINQFPANATAFLIEQGFLSGYNLALTADGTICGKHECLAPACDLAPGCDFVRPPNNLPSYGDLVFTFCP
jgi:hypothetical protein